MSLPVSTMVKKGSMAHTECILCGACVDGCPKAALGYSFGSTRRERTQVPA